MGGGLRNGAESDGRRYEDVQGIESGRGKGLTNLHYVPRR